MSRPLPRSSRRAALGWGLAVAVAGSGCSGGEAPDGTAPTTSGAGSTQPEALGSPDPDTELVAQLLRELSEAHERVRLNRLRHRPLAAPLRRLERLHAQHAVELGGLLPVPGGMVSAERRQARVLARLATAEEKLQGQLMRGSIVADSGALALLLAAMAAGVAQESTRL